MTHSTTATPVFTPSRLTLAMRRAADPRAAVRPAVLGSLLALGVAGLPADLRAADTITIDGTQTFSQRLGGGQSLEITATGRLEVAGGYGVVPDGGLDHRSGRPGPESKASALDVRDQG